MFKKDLILRYKFDRISPGLTSIFQLGICTETYGRNDKDRGRESIDQINRVGGLGIKILN